jgi:anti-anti-sigma factor
MLVAEYDNLILVAPQRLVAETRLEFRETALAHLERLAQGKASRLIVDLRNATEVDASGLGVLVLLMKRARDQMIVTKLLHAPLGVRRMLELTKLDSLFEMES